MPIRQHPSISQMKSAACAGKAGYADARAARAVLDRMNGRHRSCGGHVYHCRYCAAWHIGHMRPRRERARTLRREEDWADE